MNFNPQVSSNQEAIEDVVWRLRRLELSVARTLRPREDRFSGRGKASPAFEPRGGL